MQEEDIYANERLKKSGEQANCNMPRVGLLRSVNYIST